MHHHPFAKQQEKVEVKRKTKPQNLRGDNSRTPKSLQLLDHVILQDPPLPYIFVWGSYFWGSPAPPPTPSPPLHPPPPLLLLLLCHPHGNPRHTRHTHCQHHALILMGTHHRTHYCHSLSLTHTTHCTHTLLSFVVTHLHHTHPEDH